ncbi:hypothetical protein [Brachybacterium sillae]|nr:hypothetical protein [Brachybacterium sillae]
MSITRALTPATSSVVRFAAPAMPAMMMRASMMMRMMQRQPSL